MKRRQVLAGLAAASASVAGCSGGDGGNADGGDSAGNGDRSSGTGAGESQRHAALAGIDDQPHLGPPPGEADGTIVAFEDPSCPRCRAFERQVRPTIEDELTSQGRATFVFRGYPVVYSWGEPATLALEATYERDEAAHWALADHYFADQDAFRGSDAATVYDRTRAFLASETEVDAETVTTAARDGDADAAVQTDLDAGRAAGAGSTTPTLFLFRDGEYRTTARGSVSYSVVESALGV